MRCGGALHSKQHPIQVSYTRVRHMPSTDAVQNVASKRRTKVKDRYMDVGNKKLQIVYKQGHWVEGIAALPGEQGC